MRNSLALLALPLCLVAGFCNDGTAAELKKFRNPQSTFRNPHSKDDPDWGALAQEAARNLATLLKINTTNPPGNEAPAAEFLRSLFEREGIPAEVIPTAPGRAALVARVKGSGAKPPVVCMGHLDVVGVERDKWTVDPFGGELRDGYLYGRGAIDDKGMTVACAMAAIALKRQGVSLERDLIFLAEGDEEGSGQAGIEFLIRHHGDKISAEYVLNEGGRVILGQDGRVRYVSVQTSEKVPRNVEVVARGVSGHASMPRPDNAIVHLAAAIAKIGAYQPPARLTPTTRRFFQELASISPPEQAAAMRRLTESPAPNPASSSSANRAFEEAARLLSRDLVFNSMLRDSISPTIVQGGIRSNVIPGSATATLNIRLLPGDSLESLVDDLRRQVQDSQIEFRLPRDNRAAAPDSRFDTPLFSAIEKASSRLFPGAPVMPEMSTGATDSAPLRLKGVVAYGLLPFPLDESDIARMHGNDERIPVEALGRGVEFLYRVIAEFAGTQHSALSTQH